MGIETSPFAGAVEKSMMSADLRKLSDPQKELEAAEHFPQESSPESVASHSPRPLPTKQRRKTKPPSSLISKAESPIH